MCPDPLRELGGGGRRVVRRGDRPDDDDPAGARLQHLVQVARVDAADREPGARLPQGGGVPHEAEAGGVAAGLGGVGQQGPVQK